MKILGLGDAVLDRYTNKQIMYPGGNALNIAVFAKKMGYQTSFFGIFGSDQKGDYLKKTIDKLEIDRSHARTENGENGYSDVKIVDNDRTFMGSNAGGIAAKKIMDLTENDYEYLKGFDLIHMGLYGHVDYLLDKLQAMKLRISYDFSDNFSVAKVDDILKKIEYGFFSLSGENSEVVKEFLKKKYMSNNKILLATRGAETAIAYDGREFYEKKPNNIEPVDTMAAGDAFITAFLMSYLADEMNIVDSMSKAHDFASQVCRVNGSFGFGIRY